MKPVKDKIFQQMWDDTHDLPEWRLLANKLPYVVDNVVWRQVLLQIWFQIRAIT